MGHRLAPVLALTLLLPWCAGVRAGPPQSLSPPLGTRVEAALGTDPDAVLGALESLTDPRIETLAAFHDGPDIAVATILVVLYREHWAHAPRGDEVRIRALEACATWGGAQALAGVDAFTAPPALATRARAVAARMRSMDNLRWMLRSYVSSGVDLGASKPWPPYGGKRFVLWLVAANVLDRLKTDDLSILFSPGDTTRSLGHAGGTLAYVTLTKESLRDTKIDLGPLTSYVGRRNDEKGHMLTADERVRSAPVLADLSFPDGVILGYSDGGVRWWSRERLGIPAGVPIVVGDESPNEELRHFSDR